MFHFKKARAAQGIIDKLVVRSQQRGYTVTSDVSGACVILQQDGAQHAFYNPISWLNFLRADCDQSGDQEHDRWVNDLVVRSNILQFDIAQDIRTRDILLTHQTTGTERRIRTLLAWDNYLNRFAHTFGVVQ